MKPDPLIQPQPRSHLFTVRVWQEVLDDDQCEWRGKVQHVTNGEAFYFRQWSKLVSHMVAWLEEGKETEK